MKNADIVCYKLFYYKLFFVKRECQKIQKNDES